MPRQHSHHGHKLRIGRYSEIGWIYMVTTVTRGRKPIFADWYSGCACARVLHHFPTVASVTSLSWVVMPDHVHWLFSLDDGTLDNVMRRFKTYSARSVNNVRCKDGPIWQKGYHDHAVRRQEDLRTLARYIIANPVRAGLCGRVGDYPFWDVAWL